MPAVSPALRVITRPAKRFLDTESAGGILLVVATLIAFVWANIPGAGVYEHLWNTMASIGIGGYHLSMNLRGWVNDGLITVFFLTVGLELKRELVVGELRDLRTAALPIMAAVGGMVGSALVYVAFTVGSPSSHGWGIPMATDLALALGVLSLLGDRVSSSVKLFVLALAVADDLGSIVVLAIFYQHDFSWVPLIAAIGLIGIAVGFRALKVSWMPLYIAIGLALWFALYEAGISPTLAGVAMGLLATTRPHLSAGELQAQRDELTDVSSARAVLRTIRIARGATPTAERLELLLHPWSSFVAVPIFAFANAGITLGGGTLANDGMTRVIGGVLFAKLIGKFVGVVGATLLAQRLGIGRLPDGMGTRDVLGIGALAGIGLTVSFLVANLAFADQARQNQAKLAVLVAAVVSALVATIIFRTRVPTVEPLADASST
jgi:Na+:H+ antiporter, NhaA family